MSEFCWKPHPKNKGTANCPIFFNTSNLFKLRSLRVVSQMPDMISCLATFYSRLCGAYIFSRRKFQREILKSIEKTWLFTLLSVKSEIKHFTELPLGQEACQQVASIGHLGHCWSLTEQWQKVRPAFLSENAAKCIWQLLRMKSVFLLQAA